jgi:hypothetical protein
MRRDTLKLYAPGTATKKGLPRVHRKTSKRRVTIRKERQIRSGLAAEGAMGMEAEAMEGAPGVDVLLG